MTDEAIYESIKRMVALKNAQKDLRLELATFCVTELGVPQDTINMLNVVDYLDGYLKGRGFWK